MLDLARVLGLILVLAGTSREVSAHCDPVPWFGCLLLLLRHDASYDSIVSQAQDDYMMLARAGSMAECCSMMSGLTSIVIPLDQHKL